MTKTDRLDRMLSRLPTDEPAEDLDRRILRYVRVRNRRRLFIRFGTSLILAAGGAWLSLPLVFTLPEAVKLPGSGLPLAWNWTQAVWADSGARLTSTWNGFTGLQSGSAAPINASVWLGLVILAVSAWLALGPLLPRNAGVVKGV